MHKEYKTKPQPILNCSQFIIKPHKNIVRGYVYSPIEGQKYKQGDSIQISGKVLVQEFYNKSLIITLRCGMEQHKSTILKQERILIKSNGTFEGDLIAPDTLPPRCYGSVGIDFQVNAQNSPTLGVFLKIPS